MSRHHAAIKNSRQWKAARAECLERDGYACVRCDSPDQLEADHIIRLVDAPELAFDLENLQTLCSDCHDEKEREYVEQLTIRNEWINPKYEKELQSLITTSDIAFL